jgi:hypothetical protein
LAEWKVFLPLQSQTKRESKKEAKGAMPELIKTERFYDFARALSEI